MGIGWSTLIGLMGCLEYAFPERGNDGSIDQPLETSVVVSNEPVADAGSDQTYPPRTQIILDGLSSVDPHGSPIVEYLWTVRSAPPNSNASLSDVASARPSVYLDLAGTYVFELTVRNQDGYWDSTPDRVQILAVPEQGLYIELTWDQPSDLDLHLMEWDGPPFSPADCTWCNPQPSWGANGPLNDPELVVSTVEGFGPEIAAIDEPEYGTTYTLGVHYYGQDGDPFCSGECLRSVLVLRVFLNGEESGPFAHQLNSRGEFWTAAQVTWPGIVDEIDAVISLDAVSCTQ